MDVLRIAAFSDGNAGGNPAGVAIADQLPDESEMQRIAADVGFSETAFAAPISDGASGWRVRYFAPEVEIPFCGHATIALGAALAMRYGDGVFDLKLNQADITVEVRSTSCRGRHGDALADSGEIPRTPGSSIRVSGTARLMSP